jgi:hypothetical protein
MSSEPQEQATPAPNRPVALATVSGTVLPVQTLPSAATKTLAPQAVAATGAASKAPAPNPASTRGQTLARARTALVQVIPQLQYRIVRLGPAGQAGLAALVAAAVVAVSALVPARNAIESLRADILHAQRPHTAVTEDDGISRVVATLPTREQVPAVLGVVYQQAQSVGVQLDSGHYAFTPAKPGGVARYELEFPVKASYPDIRTFINRTLTAVPAAGLTKLHIERKAVGDAVVNADVHFVIFVRSE